MHNPTGAKMDLLHQAGFVLLGEWIGHDEGIKLNFTPAKDAATVYAFIVDGELKYIGLTQNCFRVRMSGYRNGKATQRTNIRVRGLIRAALDSGSKVQVLAVAPNEEMQWRGLPINVAVGLEAGLIKKLKPIWNMLNVQKEQKGGLSMGKTRLAEALAKS
jgi:hypothetical protein